MRFRFGSARFPSDGNLSVPVYDGSDGERRYVQTRLSRRNYFQP